MSKRTISLLAFLSMILLAFAACGDDGGDGGGGVDAGPEFGDCPTDSTADEMAGASVIAQKCNVCHSTNAANRQGAPAAVNFDTAAEVMTRDSRINARSVVGSTMPPGTPLTAEEKEQVRIYLACGVTLDPQ